ncbi:hypothetical protein MMC07_003890 [Pseudocyphellaria aurata]|nr:hypothetical protein [Pseudocyphellaria aurata]
MDVLRQNFLQPEIVIHATLRQLQFVLALTVAGIYGSSINDANKPIGILWIAVLAIFARLYIDDHPNGVGSSKQVKSAAFVDLTNMILWFVTALCGAAVFLRSRYGAGEEAKRNDND